MTNNGSQLTNKSGQNAELREKLAAVQHEIWAHWMKYLFSVTCARGGEHTICYETAKRWKRQIGMPYNELSEREKESDRDQADKVLAIFSAEAAQFQEQFLRLGEELRRKTEECDKLRADIASLKWDYDEAMLQYDMAQKRACEAEAELKQVRSQAQEQSEAVQRGRR